MVLVHTVARNCTRKNVPKHKRTSKVIPREQEASKNKKQSVSKKQQFDLATIIRDLSPVRCPVENARKHDLKIGIRHTGIRTIIHAFGRPLNGCSQVPDAPQTSPSHIHIFVTVSSARMVLLWSRLLTIRSQRHHEDVSSAS